jgi:hypothetical protein
MRDSTSVFLAILGGSILLSLLIVVLGDVFAGRPIKFQIARQSHDSATSPRTRKLQVGLSCIGAVLILFGAIFESPGRKSRTAWVAVLIVYLALNLAMTVHTLREQRRWKAERGPNSGKTPA